MEEAKYLEFLKEKLDKDNFLRLIHLDNPYIIDFVGEFTEICQPEKVIVVGDKKEDIEFIKKISIEKGEEIPLTKPGQTVHFDGYYDQARDKKNTRYLLYENYKYSSYINGIPAMQGLTEIKSLLKGIMAGKDMFVGFFSLGPRNSEFSLPAVQITDSAYVIHSENILYRPCYSYFKSIRDKKSFFKFVHSSGRLKNNVSMDVDKRRIYIDLENNLVWSVNTQYAGNAVGLKKLALRLAIKKASQEGWLAEHMFLVGIDCPDEKKERVYLCGAYPSMCGKTSTALMGDSIVGDDIVYLRKRDGYVYGVNVERGIFGIIHNVNRESEPLLFEALNKSREVIFVNVLVDEKGEPFWVGKDTTPPSSGINFSGKWYPGKLDDEGEEIPPSHKNARFVMGLQDLVNVDSYLDEPFGIKISGIIYGGRDCDTALPVEEAFNWYHGVLTKAVTLESETTAATLGKEGVRVFNPMANIDFVSIPLGRYIQMHLDFGRQLKKPPRIFSVNYFLSDSKGKFLNEIEDKKVWLKWMSLRIKEKLGAIKLPTGFIPLYEDLKKLFKDILGKNYGYGDYTLQFTLRVPENLNKIDRIINIYKKIDNCPDGVFSELLAQKERLLKVKQELGSYPSPEKFAAAGT